jgi:hypothetical protein
MVNGCASTASNTEKGTTGSYFTGSGGQEIRLGILVPQSQGLNEKDYIPAMVQGVLVANMRKYSAISVLDRVSLDRVITETLNPTYEDNFDIVRLGHVAQVGYMMTGNIIRTSSGYSMQINVTDTTPNANTIASYSGNFSVAQFDDYTAINRASIDLLSQMGVALTAAAKNELGRASPRQDITAQTAMAQGIVAQRKGQTVEAILHYFDATALESIATEALSRMSMATTTIATGSLGNQIRNDIEQRKEWVRLIEETRKYFANNPQYALAELYFSPKLDLTSINYTAETANLSFPVQVRLNSERANAMIKIVSDINNGLEATGRRLQWGIKDVSVEPILYAYIFDFELVNERGKVVSSVSSNAFFLFWDGGHLNSFSLYPYFIASTHTPSYQPNGYAINQRNIVSANRLKSEIISWNKFRYPMATYIYNSGSNNMYLPLYFNVVGSFSAVAKYSASVQNMQNEINIENIVKQNPRNVSGRWVTSTSDNITPSSQNFNSFFHDTYEKLFAEYKSPGFVVKASDITDTLTIRLKNISVYNLVRPNAGRKGVVNPNSVGNNIIPVRTGTF